MNYYNEIRNKLIDNEIYRRVKDYSKERNRVKTYFEIGVNVNLFLDKNVNFKFGHFDSFYTIIFCYFLTVQFYLLFYMNYLLY